MTISSKKVGLSTALALLLAALGILTPIVHESYQRRKSLELRQVAVTSLVTDELNIEKLQVTYAGQSIPTITKLAFSLENNGRTPIRADEIVEAPRITFSSGARILEVQRDSASPAEVAFAIHHDTATSTIHLTFPLLNPEEALSFSVLVGGSMPVYKAVSRIAGASPLAMRVVDTRLRRGVLQQGANFYVACVFTLFGWLLVVVTIHTAGVTSLLQKLYQAGTIPRPSPQTKEKYQEFVRTVDSAVQTDTLKQIRVMLHSLPTEHALSGDEENRLHSIIASALLSRASHWLTGLLFAGLSLAGTNYILRSFFG